MDVARLNSSEADAAGRGSVRLKPCLRNTWLGLGLGLGLRLRLGLGLGLGLGVGLNHGTQELNPKHGAPRARA